MSELKDIDRQLTENINEDPKQKVAYLEELGFTDTNIREFVKEVPAAAIEELNESSSIVKTNISYLKKLGISDYQEAFLRFYNMFLIEPATFDEIFAKYDSDDLIEKLEKNIAIMEHL